MKYNLLYYIIFIAIILSLVVFVILVIHSLRISSDIKDYCKSVTPSNCYNYCTKTQSFLSEGENYCLDLFRDVRDKIEIIREDKKQ